MFGWQTEFDEMAMPEYGRELNKSCEKRKHFIILPLSNPKIRFVSLNFDRFKLYILWFVIWKIRNKQRRKWIRRFSGLLAILSAIYPTHVQTFIYVYLGELLDLLSLINCLTSFTLYSLMSSTYRYEFYNSSG